MESIDHAIAAGDVNYAADELDQHWLEVYSAGQATKVLGWIDSLPDEVVHDHPGLALARAGIGRAVGQLDEVEPWLARAEAAAADAPAAGFASSLAAGAALGRSLYRLALGDVEGALEWAQRAVELEQARGAPSPRPRSISSAWSCSSRSPDRAEPLLCGLPGQRARPGSRTCVATSLRPCSPRCTCCAATWSGGERLAREALELARAAQLEEHPPTQQVHAALGAVHHARGDLARGGGGVRARLGARASGR